MIRAALYIRVSTEEQVLHGLSIDAQKEALETYAKKHAMNIVDYYIDEGITARKKVGKRKEFLRLLEDVKNYKIETILFTKLDRWFRNISDYYKVQEILEQHGVNWKTIFENYDTSTASGRLHINIMLSVAQDEADRTSERIKSVFKHKLDNGECLNSSAPFGYKILDKKLVLEEEEAKQVQEIFDIYELKRSISATQRWYIQTYQKKVSYEFISRMLKREIYIGKNKSNPSFCEPIITKEQYYRVNSTIGTSFSRLGNTGLIYLFSGLIICDTCDRRMNGIAGYTPKPTKYYGCRHGMHFTTCTHNKRCREDNIEKKALSDMHVNANTKISKLEIIKEKSKNSEKNAIKKKLNKLKDLYVADLLLLEDYQKDYASYQKQLKALNARDCKSLKEHDYSEVISLIKLADYRMLYHKLDDEHKRLFWHNIISEIRITDTEDIRILFK